MNPNAPQPPADDPTPILPLVQPVEDPLTIPYPSLPQDVLNARKALDRLIGTASDLASQARRGRNQLKLLANQLVPLLTHIRRMIEGEPLPGTREGKLALAAELHELITRLDQYR